MRFMPRVCGEPIGMERIKSRLVAIATHSTAAHFHAHLQGETICKKYLLDIHFLLLPQQFC